MMIMRKIRTIGKKCFRKSKIYVHAFLLNNKVFVISIDSFDKYLLNVLNGNSKHFYLIYNININALSRTCMQHYGEESTFHTR